MLLFTFALTAHSPAIVASCQGSDTVKNSPSHCYLFREILPHTPYLHLKPVIYFDFGGVVAQPDSQIQLSYLVETLGFPSEALRDSPYLRWMQLHPKELDFLKQKSEEYHIHLTDDDLVQYSEIKRNSVREVPGIRELIMNLRKMNYEVNLVTNIRSENFDIVVPFLTLFNEVVHCPKTPGERREAWEMEWASHNMKPDQFLLIDDQEPNVREADRLGMQSIQFENVNSLTEKLIEQRIITLPQ